MVKVGNRFDVYLNRVIGNRAYMLLDGHIGPADGYKWIDGGDFANAIYWYKEQGYDITVKINSPGGSVVHGMSIMDAITTTKADTQIVGLAASMAAMIALSGAKRYANDYSVGMLHGISGDDTPFKSILSAQFAELLAKRTKLGQEKITEILTNGDHFFDSSQMMELGMIDEIVETDSIAKPNTANAKSVLELYNVFNSVLIKPNNMEFLSKLFGASTEPEAFDKALAMKNQNAEYKSKIETLQNELAEAKAKVETAEAMRREQDATALVDKAIADGKIEASGKDALKALAMTDIEKAKQLVVSIQKKTVSIHSKIDTSDVTMDYETMARTNPEMLADIATNSPETYQKLVNEHINKNKK